MQHLTTMQLEAGLAAIRQSPRTVGTVELIVARPAVDERVTLDEAQLDLDEGLVGDSWRARGNGRTGGPPDPDTQLNVMNARAIALVAQDRSRWALAGDQLYLDLDLSGDNLPPGTRLALGTAIIAVTAKPHRGCAKFSGRFGRDALRFVNSPVGRQLRLRGLNARIIQPGTVRRGDTVHKL
jgi:MOSC domain-containing protein YiiM